MFLSSVASFLALLPICSLAKPTQTIRRIPTPRDNAPDPASTICGDLFNEIQQDVNQFYASDVYACLTTVPFNQDVALRFLDYYNTTLQFQSTLAYVRDPPVGYQQPAVDIFAEFEEIRANVQQGFYKNEYAFETHVQQVVYAVHDAHVDLRAGILNPFSFGSPWQISAVSVDGKAEPQIYITDDIIDAQNDGWTWTPSPVVRINGTDTVSFLREFATLNSVGNLEPHADWNQLMEHPALDILGDTALFFGGGTFYPGDELLFEFENQTSLDTYWIAIYSYLMPTGNITNGTDFFNVFVLAEITDSSDDGSSDNSSDSSSYNRKRQSDGDDDSSNGTISWYDDSYGAYPNNPDVVQDDLAVTGGGAVSGYFLHDISTGVLSIPTFKMYGDDVDTFSSAVQAFVDVASGAGIARVVIDLQQNTGGAAALAYDAFRRFFPTVDPFAGSRRRSHPLANVLGKIMTEWWSGLDYDGTRGRAEREAARNYTEYAADEWVVTPRLSAATGRNFSSWAEYYTPLAYRGDRFSEVERYNLSSDVFDYAAFGWVPYGYAENPIKSTQSWEPENIILLTDGLCSSTCSMFVEFMTQMGVRTVVAGGVPAPGPMQAVSGTRGARAYSAGILDQMFALVGSMSSFARSELPPIPQGSSVRDSGIWTSSAGINLRDQIRASDLASGAEPVPLQFKYEAADCRIYYTLTNLYNMSRLWRDAAAAAWGDAGLCVPDSTGFSPRAAAPNPPPQPTAYLVDLLIDHPEWNVFAPGTVQPTAFTKSDDADGVDDDGDTDDGGDGGIVDGPTASKDQITLCTGARKDKCGSGYYCRNQTLTCDATTKSKVKVPVCLPQCDDVLSCEQDYDVDDAQSPDHRLGFQCLPQVVWNTKMSTTKLSGAGSQSKSSGPAKSSTAGSQTKKYIHVCVPTYGTHKLGCPKPDPVATTTRSS